MADLISNDQLIALEELERRGALDDANTKVLSNARSGQVDVKSQKIGFNTVSRMIHETPADQLPKPEAEAMLSIWSKQAFGTENTKLAFGAKTDVITAYRQAQNMLDPGRHLGVMSKFERQLQWTDEQRTEQARKDGLFFPGDAELFANIGPEQSGLISAVSENLGFGKQFVNQRDADEFVVRKWQDNLLRDAYLPMRRLYESSISKPGIEYARAIADGAQWNISVFSELSNSDKQLIPEYIQLMKKSVDGNLFTTSGLRIAVGFKDMAIGAVEYLSFKAAEGVFGALGEGQALLDLDKVKTELAAERRALRTKFDTKTFLGSEFLGKGVGQIADSVPLIVSLAASAKLKAVGWGAQLLAAGVPTAAIARDFEAEMISRGVDEDSAAIWAFPTAATVMLVEKMALDNLIKIPKAKFIQSVSTKLMEKWLTKAGSAFVIHGGDLALRAGLTGLNEITEEVIQEIAKELAIEMQLGELELGRLAILVAETAKEVAPSAVLFGLGGGGAGVVGDGIRSRTLAQNSDDFKRIARESEDFSRVLFDDAEISEEEKVGAFDKIFDAWQQGKTEEDQDSILRASGVTNIADAKVIFDDLIEAEKKFTGEFRRHLSPKRQARLESQAKTFGFNVRFKTDLGTTESADAEFDEKSGDILVDPTLLQEADSAERLQEEILHGISVQGGITDIEMEVLRENAAKWIKEFDIDARYPTASGIEKIEEAIAQKGAELTNPERTLLGKVIDFFRKILGGDIKIDGKKPTAAQLFNTIIERRREEVAKGAQKQAAEAVQEEGADRGQAEHGQDRQGAKAQKEVKRAARTQAISREDALNILVNRVLTGRDVVQSTVDALVAGTDIKQESLLSLAHSTANRVRGRVQGKPGLEAVRKGVIESIVREQRREAAKAVKAEAVVQAARAKGKAEVKAAKRKAKRQAKLSAAELKEQGIRKRQGFTPDELRAQGVDLEQDIIADKPIADIVDSVLDAVDKQAVKDGLIKEDAGIDEFNRNVAIRNDFAKTMGNALVELIDRVVPAGETRGSIIKRARKLRINRTSGVKALVTEANKILASTREQAIKSTVRALKSEITKTFKEFEGQKKLSNDMREQLRIGKKMEAMGPTELIDTIREADRELEEIPPKGITPTEQIRRDQKQRQNTIKSRMGRLVLPLTSPTPSPVQVAQILAEVQEMAGGARLAIAEMESKRIAKNRPKLNKLDKAVTDARKQLPAENKDNEITLTGLKMLNSELKLSNVIKFAKGAVEKAAQAVITGFQKRIATGTFEQQAIQERVDERKLEAIRRNYGIEKVSRKGEKAFKVNEFRIMRELREHDPNLDKFALEESRQPITRAKVMWFLAVIRQKFYRDLAESEVREGDKMVPKNKSLRLLLDNEQAMRDAIEPEDLQMVDDLTDIISDELTPAEFAMAVKITGIELDLSESFYFPTAFDFQDESNVEIAQSLQLTPPSHELRTRHSLDLDYSQDLFTMFDGLVENSTRFVAFGELTQDMQDTLLKGDFRKNVSQTYGEKYERVIHDHLLDILTGRPPVAKDNVPGLSPARAFIAFKYITGNIGSLSKQFFGTLALSNHMAMPGPINMYTRAFNNPRGKQIRAKVSDHVAFRRRTQGSITELAENAMNEAGNLAGSFVGRAADKIHPDASKFLVSALRLGPKTTGYVDAMGALMVAPGAIDAIIEQDPEIAAISDVDARESAAVDRYMDIVEQTLQSSQLKDLSLWLRRGGDLTKAGAQFLSAPGQQLGFMFQHFQVWRADPTNTKKRNKFWQAVILNHFVIPTIFSGVGTALQALLGDEPDEGEIFEWILSMMLGPFSSIIFAGGVITAFARSATYAFGNAMLEMAGREPISRPRFGERAIPAADVQRDAKLIGDTIGHLFGLDGDGLSKDWERAQKTFTMSRDFLKLLTVTGIKEDEEEK